MSYFTIEAQRHKEIQIRLSKSGDWAERIRNELSVSPWSMFLSCHLHKRLRHRIVLLRKDRA